MLEDTKGWKIEFTEVTAIGFKCCVSSPHLIHVHHVTIEYVCLFCCSFVERRRSYLQQSSGGGREGLQAGGGAGSQRGGALRPPVCQSGGDAPVEPEHTADQSESLTLNI